VSFLLAFVAVVLGVVAVTRTKAMASLQHRVSELENDLTDLRRRFNVLRREVAPQEAAPAPQPPPEPAPAPVPVAIAPPAPPVAISRPAPQPAPRIL